LPLNISIKMGLSYRPKVGQYLAGADGHEGISRHLQSYMPYGATTPTFFVARLIVIAFYLPTLTMVDMAPESFSV
jgi:hypothetical protein